MPFHDLNIFYKENDPNLSNSLTFAHELGYTTVALTITIHGKVPPQLPTFDLSRLTIPPPVTVLKRLTLVISDTSQNHRISQLSSTYDLIALRPTTEKAFQLCTSTLDCDLISLDLTSRLAFPIKFKTVASALQRGVRFEVTYSPGILGGSDARRNLIAGAASLIRATRGRGIVVSSEARGALGLRGWADVINLATVWGLSQERGKESICEEAGRVVRLAGIKRTSFRGVVDVIEDGTKEVEVAGGQETLAKIGGLPSLKHVTVVPDKTANLEKAAKRKASQASLNEPVTSTQSQIAEGKRTSKRQMKREAKKARLDRVKGKHDNPNKQSRTDKGTQEKESFPIQHESLAAVSANATQAVQKG